MSPDFSDFRIIDIECIDILNNDIEVQPHRLLCGHFPPNRSNSKLPGPVGTAAEFLKVDISKNELWPNNLTSEIEQSISKIQARKIEAKK